MRSLIVLILIPVAGCTSLGAMPGMTGASYTPESRPGAEVSAGMVPGYALSSAATENISAGPLVQVATFLDPGEWFGKASGLGLGMRWFPWATSLSRCSAIDGRSTRKAASRSAR